MAAKTVEVEELMNTVLVCDVCMEPFDSGTRVPLLLPCRHSFCLSCLDSLSKGGDFRCPTCRHLVPVSGPMSTSLPKDIISLKVVDYLTMKSAVQKVPCTDCVDKNTAGYRCLTCHLNLCQACQDGHRRVPFFRSHTVRSLQELAAAPGDFLAEAETCGEHVGVALNLYCDSQACKVALCTSCAMVAHRQDSHNIVDLSKVHERAKKEYVELLGLLEKEEKKQTGISDDAKEKMELVEASAATATDQVNQAMDRLLEAAEKWRTQLLEEVRQTKDRQTAELEKIQEETSSHVSQIQEATGYLRRAERLSRQAEFISVVHAQGPSIRKLATSGLFTGVTKSFSDDYPGLSDFPRWTDPIQFEAGDDEVTTKALRCVGSVRDRWSLSVSTIQTNCGPWIPKEMLTQFAEEAQLVMAGNEMTRVLVKVCLVLKVLLGQILVIKPSRPDQALVSQDVSSVVIHPSSDKTVTYTPVSAFGKMATEGRHLDADGLFNLQDKVTLIFDTTETAQKFLIAVVGVQQSLRSGVLGVKSPAMVQPPGASKFGNLVWSSPSKPGLASSQPSSSPGKPAGVASTAPTTTTAATAPGFFGTKTSMASQPVLTTTPTPADGQKSVLGGFTFGKPEATSQETVGPAGPALSLAQQFQPQPGSWECSGCLLSNKSDVLRCPACQTLKPRVKPEDVKDTGSGVKVGSAAASAGSFQFGYAQKSSEAPAQTGGFQFGSGGGFQFGAKTASPAPGASQASSAVQEAETRPVPKSFGNKTLLEQLQADDIGMKPDATSTPVASAYTPGTAAAAATQPKPEESKGFGFSVLGGGGGSMGFQFKTALSSSFRDECSWECSGCLLSNKADVLRCPACQALKPGVTVKQV